MIGSCVAALLKDEDCILLDKKGGCDASRGFEKWFKDSVVIDCAAPTRGIGSDDFIETAIVPLTILRAQPRYYMYLSSSCVYADWLEKRTENAGFYGSPETANQGYGWAKRAGELACHYSGIPHTILRLPNIYGPSYSWDNEPKHFIPAIIEKLEHGDNPLTVWGSGNQVRSFLYETDCAELILEMLWCQGTYNVPGEDATIREVVEDLAAECGYSGKIQFDTSKPEGPKQKTMDCRKMAEVLPYWSPKVSLTDGLRQTFDTYRNHRVSQPTH